MSCRWIRSRNRRQLLWVVGNRDKFNEEGLVPVNTTRNRHEWVYCQLLAAVADISGDTQDDDAWMHLFLEGMLKKTTLKNEMKKHTD